MANKNTKSLYPGLPSVGQVVPGTVVQENYSDPSGPKLGLDYTGGGDQYTGLNQFNQVVDQVWKQSGATADQFQYGYDLMGNVKYKLNVVADDLAKAGGTPATPYLDELYTYDNLGQLNEVQRGEINPTSITSGPPSMLSTTLDKQWTLDGMGNWTQVVTNGATTSTSTFSDANENKAFFYDQNGNMTNDGNQKYVYDAWNRLVEVDNGSTVLAKYAYDGLGRKIEDFTYSGGVSTGVTHYYYGGGEVIETRHTAVGDDPGNAAPVYQYVWSLAGHTPILRDTIKSSTGLPIANERIYYLTDAEGNVTSLVGDPTGSAWQVVERYVYDPYGNATFYNAAWTGGPAAETGNSFLYGGMMYDAATGLYYASARWYDPATGQFMSRDPTGFAAGDANLYRYVGDNPATMTDPWGLSGGGGGDGTWDPGNVSPLMPMDARDTPCDGPMVTEMGLNVPSPLMPMIAPDTPFEGPMVNYLDAYGSPWMPMHSPDEPFEGPMVNYLDAYGAPWMPMHSPDEPYEGQFVNYLGAKQRVQVDPSSVKFRVVEVHAEVTTGDGSKIMVKSPFRAILDYVKDGSWDVIKKCGQEWRSWLAGKWSVTRIAQELRDEVKSGIDSCLAALKLGLTEAETKMFVTDVQVTATVEVTYRVKVLNEDGTGEWETRTQTVPVVLAMKNSLLINILSKAGVDELIGVVQRLGRDAIGKLDGVDAMAGAAFWAWLYGEYNVFKW